MMLNFFLKLNEKVENWLNKKPQQEYTFLTFFESRSSYTTLFFLYRLRDTFKKNLNQFFLCSFEVLSTL